jgi:hypothetical protein
MDRYLMLDIDGVLHPARHPYDLRFAENLLPIILEFELKVVITSDWRKNAHFPTLTQKLGRLGNYCVGMTPDFSAKDAGSMDQISLVGLRQSECEYWLSRSAMRPLARVALDDVRTHYLPTCDWVFVCNPDVGLAAEAAGVFKTWVSNQINAQESRQAEQAKLFSLGADFQERRPIGSF